MAAIGLALAALRQRQGMTQEQAAEAMGITRQAWQNYEAGERQVVLRTDMQATLARAIGVSRADLLQEAQRRTSADLGAAPPSPGGGAARAFEVRRIGGVAGESRQIDLRELIGTGQAVEVEGDELTPWVSAGEVVFFDRQRHPKRGAGCVIEFLSGDLKVALYERQAAGLLQVRELYPEERVVTYPLADIRGVYAVTVRGV